MSRALRPYNGSSGAERRAYRRDQLIAAAIGVYADLGYANATVRRICAAAKLTERYFYESFRNGEDLLGAAFVEIARRLDDAIDQVPLDVGTGVEALRGKLTAYFETLRAHPAESRVFLMEILGNSSEVDLLFERTMDRFASKLLPFTDQSQNESVSALLTRGMTGGLLHMARYWIDNRYDPPTGIVVDAALALCRGVIVPPTGSRGGE